MKGSVLMYQVATVALLALACSLAFASDPSPLQDFCVAVDKYDSADFYFLHAVFVNGKDTSGKQGSNVTTVTAKQFPGLNTLGISLARLDFAPYGQNPPHTHPRATEVLFVLEGTLYVGFVTSNQADGKNILFTKVLNVGDVFVFPVGLVHFQLNIRKSNAIAFAGLSSQNPGVITIANAVFGSEPPINSDLLTKAFQVDKNLVEYLQKVF
ncbi:hypothetical protein I3842_05G056900 [Carya illinoinensis]|uniref:Cupin type-1 domain-containing protein n=1 Tax=Carya illinoinensis TaxID=32201 RepID=A0A922EWM2_CARIL|nr:hypothetical protein I3842_05G056900 [Carya illinoinensis]